MIAYVIQLFVLHHCLSHSMCAGIRNASRTTAQNGLRRKVWVGKLAVMEQVCRKSCTCRRKARSEDLAGTRTGRVFLLRPAPVEKIVSYGAPASRSICAHLLHKTESLPTCALCAWIQYIRMYTHIGCATYAIIHMYIHAYMHGNTPTYPL